MADPNSKKFIIIPEGTTLFPETGKKRVRVFEDKKLSDLIKSTGFIEIEEKKY